MLRFLNDTIRFQKCPSLVLLRLITAVKQEIGKTNDANYQKRGKTKDNVLLCMILSMSYHQILELQFICFCKSLL